MRTRALVPCLLALLTLSATTSARDSERDPITPEELGRLLFWDPVLSGPRDIACATCHHPDFGYADGRDLSLGAGAVGLGPLRSAPRGRVVPPVKRNSPTVLNTAYNGVDRRGRGRRGNAVTDQAILTVDQARAPMFWDRRARSLETQALEPLKAADEMRGSTYPESVAVDSVVARLRAIPEYVALFREAFGSSVTIDADQLARALAAFQRSLVAMNSPFDRYRAGDSTALTPQQVRGLDEFDDAGCDSCHGGPMFSDFDLEAEGVPEHPLLALPDSGAGRFRFRTPSLRNVALTAPYMHNGTLATLADVLRFYDNGRSENPNVIERRQRGDRRDGGAVLAANDGRAALSRQFVRVDDMSDREMEDIIAFLGALTDEDYDRSIPARVPSGLPPAGY
ncbi:MAG: cytochrome c peroxidase [Gemmatimonadota bacterium]